MLAIYCKIHLETVANDVQCWKKYQKVRLALGSKVLKCYLVKVLL